MDIEPVIYWISERETIRSRRDAGAPRPWTSDPILHAFRFCNVRREDDAVTRWIAQNWRQPHAADPHLWFAMATARFLNWPDTMDAVGWPVPWDREHFKAVLRARDGVMFGPAYVVGNGGSKKPKVDFVADDILNRLWRSRDHMSPAWGTTLEAYCQRLMDFDNVGSFMAGQIIADLKYAGPLRSAPDWMTFAVSGPGSRRGLNRVLGRDAANPWTSEASWRAAFDRFEAAIRSELRRIGLGDLHAQDLQNCLCELDKFLRAKSGQGRPKRRF